MREKLTFILDEIKKAGADKAVCNIDRREKHEINVESGKITLMRTIFDTSAGLTAIVDGRKSGMYLNCLEEGEISKAAAELCENASSSQPDEANDISGIEPGETFFSAGLEKASEELLYDRVAEFIDELKKNYPQISLSLVCSFDRTESFYGNSNGVRFGTVKGYYDINMIFAAVEGEKSSSMMGTQHVLSDLDKPFIDLDGVRNLLSDTIAQIYPKSIGDKFVGDIVFAPSVVPEFAGYFCEKYLSDKALIEGTSLLKNKLGETVISPLITLRDEPVGLEMRFVTADGFREEDTDYVKDGKLESFMLSLYGSKKTGLPRAKSSGNYVTVMPGETPRDELFAGVKRGILLFRFSGGNPSDSGDISGVAKNSFYIEDGKIAYPVNETMIAGNLLEMLKNVAAVSRETQREFGIASPWVRVTGVNITGA